VSDINKVITFPESAISPLGREDGYSGSPCFVMPLETSDVKNVTV